MRYIVLRPNFFDPAVFGTLRERIEGTASLKLLAGLPAPGNEYSSLVFENEGQRVTTIVTSSSASSAPSSARQRRT